MSQGHEDDLKQNLFLIPLKFRGKSFLGLAQLSKIFIIIIISSVNIKPPRHRFGLSLCLGLAIILQKMKAMFKVINKAGYMKHDAFLCFCFVYTTVYSAQN